MSFECDRAPDPPATREQQEIFGIEDPPTREVRLSAEGIHVRETDQCPATSAAGVFPLAEDFELQRYHTLAFLSEGMPNGTWARHGPTRSRWSW